MQTSLIGMEACSGAHFLGRVLRSQGHDVNSYLRKLLVHGARSAVLRVKRERSPLGPWLDSLEQRAPVKVVITAAANKLARVAWAVLSSGEEYRVPMTATAA
jgi:transposase